MIQSLSRREIIKTIFVTSACSIINNKLWAAKLVGEVTGNAINPTVGIARINLAPFTALNTNGGSVRLGSSSLSGDVPRGALYPIIINRVSATEYVVVDSACLHEGAVIGRLLSGRMTCPRHSSQYEIHGVCTRGPAPIGASLNSYPNSLANGILTIELPDQGFSFTQQEVVNANEKRLALTWDALELVEYEVRHRLNLQTEALRVNCSLTPTGTFTTGLIPGIVNGGTRTVYVQPQDGFFQIAINLKTV
ncbi:MAG TPA: Rieske (2Fe-2S) protein [Verrucomicrobiae bacterium]|nr:Rieske (2Fe-2S) protein [Verrucomicrobiae bacterium]